MYLPRAAVLAIFPRLATDSKSLRLSRKFTALYHEHALLFGVCYPGILTTTRDLITCTCQISEILALEISVLRYTYLHLCA